MKEYEWLDNLDQIINKVIDQDKLPRMVSGDRGGEMQWIVSRIDPGRRVFGRLVFSADLPNEDRIKTELVALAWRREPRYRAWQNFYFAKVYKTGSFATEQDEIVKELLGPFKEAWEDLNKAAQKL